MRCLLWTIIVYTCVFQGVGGKRILLLPTQTNSHVFEQVEGSTELIKRGHEVYMTLGHTFEHIERVRDTGIVPLIFTQKNTRSIESILGFIWEPNKIFSKYNLLSQRVMNDCESVVENDELMMTLRQLKFDIAVVDAFIMSMCNFIIPKILGIPYVHMFSLSHPWELGLPALPSVSSMTNAMPLAPFHFMDNMSLAERLMNLILYLAFMIYIPLDGRNDKSLLLKFAPQYSSWEALKLESELFFVTRDHLLEFPMPAWPNVIYTPGITGKPAKPLGKGFKGIVDESDGFILVAFGDNFRNIPTELATRLVAAFNQFEDTVIWKVSGVGRSEFQMHDNIHVFDHLPQNDLLGHPKLKMFLTHCGNNGQYEALYHGVPMVGMATHAEQGHNSFRMAAHGYGIHIQGGLQYATTEDIVAAIKEIKQNSSYKGNIVKASRIMRKYPMSTSETIAYWLEHVMEFGSGHLRSHSYKMSLYQVFMLDILGIILVGLFACVYAFRLLLCCFFRLCLSKKLKAE